MKHRVQVIPSTQRFKKKKKTQRQNQEILPVKKYNYTADTITKLNYVILTFWVTATYIG